MREETIMGIEATAIFYKTFVVLKSQQDRCQRTNIYRNLGILTYIS